jgi:hypothetical protein
MPDAASAGAGEHPRKRAGEGDVSLADLFTAFRELRPDGEARDAVARMLHFGGSAEPGAARVSGAYGSTRSPERDAEPPRPGRLPPLPPPAPAPARPPAPTGEGAFARVEVRRPGGSAKPPAWARKGPLLVPAEPAEGVPAPRMEPLFAPPQRRGILAAALATQVEEGPLDVAEILAHLSALRPLRRIPRRPVPTLRRGVQLLVDHSPAMAPYAADAEALAREMAEVAGAPGMQVLAFSGSPTRGVFSALGEVEAWRPPPRGTPVAVVSELGIGGPLVGGERGTRREWLEVARRARVAGCPVVALVPFGPRRWDPALARAMTLVHWDRPTTAGAVRRALRREGR